MSKQDSFSMQELPVTQTEPLVKPETLQTSKKQFIEPELSTPVDVLEATTFFQAVTTGTTNP